MMYYSLCAVAPKGDHEKVIEDLAELGEPTSQPTSLTCLLASRARRSTRRKGRPMTRPSGLSAASAKPCGSGSCRLR
jgi:hypothetical protein